MTTTNEAGASLLRRTPTCGFGGKGGAYLARFLLTKGCGIVGTSRDAADARRGGPRQLDVAALARAVSLVPDDICSFLQPVTRVEPDVSANWPARPRSPRPPTSLPKP